MSGADATSLHKAARDQGMITLFEDGLRKVVQGQTSLEEVMRVTQDQSESEEVPEAVAADLSLAQPVSV
jgi:general secretion pathway protein E